MSNTMSPVLIIGGSGVVGSETARTLRRLDPDLPIAIGGRDLAKAKAVAAEIGNAVATAVNLARPDLGQSSEASYSAVVVFVKDDTLNSLRYALAKGLPYLSVSSGTFEIGPEVALFIHNPDRSPVVLASQWLAGAAVFGLLAIGVFYYPTTFTAERQTVFGWFENDVYLAPVWPGPPSDCSGFPQDLRPVAVGQDEPAFIREDFRRHLGMRREEEAVGMQPVFRPFPVDTEILDRGFDLDDPDIAFRRERHEVGPPAGGQRNLR
jgi:hypothetical protein